MGALEDIARARVVKVGRVLEERCDEPVWDRGDGLATASFGGPGECDYVEVRGSNVAERTDLSFKRERYPLLADGVLVATGVESGTAFRGLGLSQGFRIDWLDAAKTSILAVTRRRWWVSRAVVTSGTAAIGRVEGRRSRRRYWLMPATGSALELDVGASSVKVAGEADSPLTVTKEAWPHGDAEHDLTLSLSCRENVALATRLLALAAALLIDFDRSDRRFR